MQRVRRCFTCPRAILSLALCAICWSPPCREAIDRLWRLPGFRPGPDTDILGGENRGGVQSLRHFSQLGQRRAGLLWFAAVWNELNRNP